MKQKIYSETMIAEYRRIYVNTHAKFIHHSPLKADDLDKEFILNQRQVKLVGINDDKLAVVYEISTKKVFVAELHDIRLALLN